eukprot:TRINITY_DN1650_c0_g1_i1.p1 TRINITY_DN1650_c0_g1~~TRINITY_DN1650_c0_g1_i1.p1  ORF type:complete len:311 (-),score=82.93 TRINITY_DN1650_c0_g1_i1:332-1264(-)
MQGTEKKLDLLLSPDVFHRPSAVVVVNLEGLRTEWVRDNVEGTKYRFLAIEDSAVEPAASHSPEHELVLAKQFSKLDIHVVDNENGRRACSGNCLMNELSSLGWIQSSDVSVHLEDMKVSLPGSSEVLDMSKEEDVWAVRDFLSMLRTIKEEAIDFRPGRHSLILYGKTTGLKKLTLQYNAPMEKIRAVGQLFFSALVDALSEMQHQSGGMIAPIVFMGEDNAAADTALQLMLTKAKQLAAAPLGMSMPRVSERILTETTVTLTYDELVQRVVMWMTGLVLLIASLMTVYALAYMPITKDTLLYSGAKLE